MSGMGRLPVIISSEVAADNLKSHVRPASPPYQGVTATPRPLEVLTKLVVSENVRWSNMIKRAGMKAPEL